MEKSYKPAWSLEPYRIQEFILSMVFATPDLNPCAPIFFHKFENLFKFLCILPLFVQNCPKNWKNGEQEASTSGHEGGSYCSAAPVRVDGFSECSRGGHMSARHGRSRVDVVLDHAMIVRQLCGRGCLTPCCKDIQPRCCNVRPPKEQVILSLWHHSKDMEWKLLVILRCYFKETLN